MLRVDMLRVDMLGVNVIREEKFLALVVLG